MNRFTSDSLGRSLYILRMRVTLLAVLLLGLSGLALAATLPTGFVETQIASGLSGPTAMEIAPDGRIFVLEEGGRVRVIKNNQLLATPFITLTTNTAGERGVLGIAFDPNFASNRFVYLYYTATSPTIHNRVSRFTANGDVAVAGSEVQLLNLPTVLRQNPIHLRFQQLRFSFSQPKISRSKFDPSVEGSLITPS